MAALGAVTTLTIADTGDCLDVASVNKAKDDSTHT
jgi:hypothetical protein